MFCPCKTPLVRHRLCTLHQNLNYSTTYVPWTSGNRTAWIEPLKKYKNYFRYSKMSYVSIHNQGKKFGSCHYREWILSHNVTSLCWSYFGVIVLSRNVLYCSGQYILLVHCSIVQNCYKHHDWNIVKSWSLLNPSMLKCWWNGCRIKNVNKTPFYWLLLQIFPH